MSRQTLSVDIEEVEEEDMIPGLDNAYVIDIERDADFRDRHNAGLGRDKICLTYHDSEGNEGYLLAPLGSTITVSREV